jgi:hypothetical protein
VFDAFDPLKGQMLCILDENGKVLKAGRKYMPELSDDELRDGYAAMVRARVADERAVSYQRQGRIYTLPTNLGQEAAAVGTVKALRPDDWMVQSLPRAGRRAGQGRHRAQPPGLFQGQRVGQRAPRPAAPAAPVRAHHQPGDPRGGHRPQHRLPGRQRGLHHLLRRRRHQPGRLQRGPELGRRVQVPGDLRVQQQPVRHLHGARPRPAARPWPRRPSPTACRA